MRAGACGRLVGCAEVAPVLRYVTELHSPKNITVGSNSPNFVLNAAFHSSPERIQILLYPHRTSNFVKCLAPFKLSKRSETRGSGYAFLIVPPFTYR